MDKASLDKLTKTIDGYKNESINLQTQLTAIPAIGPDSDGDGETEKAGYLKGYLKSIGFKNVGEINAPDKRVSSGYRPNLVAVLPGRTQSPIVWIMTHMDVVPPGDLSKWTGDPWKVRVKGDKVIGRGTEDNQQGMVSSLLAAKAFHDTGITPNLTYGLILCADEETSNKYGVQYLLEKNKRLVSKNDLIIIPDAGNDKGTMIEVAEKSILWARIHTKGVQTHGSTPEKGKNAHKAGSYMVTRCASLYHKFRKRDRLFDPPISTFEPTRKDANVPNVNTIPGEDIVYFDCRVLPNYRLSDVKKAFKQLARETEKKFKVKIDVTYPQEETAAPPTRMDAPVVGAITRAVKQLRKRTPKPMGIGGGTVGKFFREEGYPCAIWATQDENAHTPDEYCRVSAMIDDAKVFAHIAMQDVE